METLPWSKLQSSSTQCLWLKICSLWAVETGGGGGWGRAEHEGLFYCFNTLWREMVFTRRSMLVLCRRNWSPACLVIRYKYQATRTIWLSRPSQPTGPISFATDTVKGWTKHNPKSAGSDEHCLFNFLLRLQNIEFINKFSLFSHAFNIFVYRTFTSCLHKFKTYRKLLGVKLRMTAQLEETSSKVILYIQFI
jgi:hypothetical protein